MASIPYPASPGGGLNPDAAEHLLVMHCLREDSLLGQEGYAVRAASTDDAGLHRWALSVDHYELPFDLRSGSLVSTQAPRRLALVPAPGGRWGLVHSSYLKEDTRGRPHSFMSHLLVYPRLDALTAAEAWGADDWPVEEHERGASKALSTFDGVPRGESVGREALELFLGGGAPSADQSLARVTFPARFGADPEVRRRWVRAAFNAYLKSIEPGAARNRVCVLAEPGAVALLVYALARLLPARLAGSFPFSTYEPPHTSFRENKVYRVVGSYSRGGLSPGDVESLRRRGYVLDTFRPVPAAELGASGPWPLEPLLDAAAAGDWDAVDGVRKLWDDDSRVEPGVTPAALGAAVRLRPLVATLADGTATPEILTEIQSTPAGAALLSRPDLRARAWDVLRPAWSRPGVAGSFPGLLVEHAGELLEATRRKAASGPLRSWADDWAALKALLPPGRRADALAGLIGAAAGSPPGPEERAGLLREWSAAAGPGAELPTGLHWLLATDDAASLRALLAGPARPDPGHAGLALCLALAGPGAVGWKPGPELLDEARDDHFAGFLHEFAEFADKGAVLARLTPATGLVPRLLKVHAGEAPTATFEALFIAARVAHPETHPFWLRGKNLQSLLERLGPGSKTARQLWTGLVSRFEPGDFDDPGCSAELATLAEARDRFPESLAPDDLARLDAWRAVNRLVNNPGAPPGTPEQCRLACSAVGLTPDAVAEQAFRRRVAPARDAAARKTEVKAYAATLLSLYGSPGAALPAALAATSAVAGDRRWAVKDELFRALVPEADRDALYYRHETDLRDTPYVPRAARSASPKAAGSSRRAARSPWVERAVSGLVGAAITALLIGLFYALNVFEPLTIARPPSLPKASAPQTAPPAGRRPVAPDKAIQLLSAENARLKASARALTDELSGLKVELTQAREEARQLKEAAEGKVEPYPPTSSKGDQSGAPRGEKNVTPTASTPPASAAGSRAGTVANSPAVTSAPREEHPATAEVPFRDVPIEINDFKARVVARDRFDFAFVTDRRSQSPVLATLRNDQKGTGHFVFYAFAVGDGGRLDWTDQRFDKKATSREVLVSNFSQNMLLYADIPQGDTQVTLKLKEKPEWAAEPKGVIGAKPQLKTEDNDRGLGFLPAPFPAPPSAPAVILALAGESFENAMYAHVIGSIEHRDQVVVTQARDNVVVRRFDASTVSGLLTTPGARVKGLSFVPRSRRLLVGYEGSSKLVLLDLAPKDQEPTPGQHRALNHDGPVLGWDANHDGSVLVTLDATDTLSFWDLTGGSPDEVGRVRKQMTPGTTCLAHGRKSGASGPQFATGSPGQVSLWQYTIEASPAARNRVSLNSSRTLSVDGLSVRKLAFSADGRVLAALVESRKPPGPATGFIRVWTVPDR